jgi:prepilin-type processing-associated H-X9-DG protein
MLWGMADRETQPTLLIPEAPTAGAVHVNGRCLLRRRDGHCVVVVCGMVLAQFDDDDAAGKAYAMVQLVEQGWAQQTEVARAFGCAARSVRRAQRRCEDGGLGALGRRGGYPQGRARTSSARGRLALRLKGEGCSTREVARQIGVDEKAVRKLLKRHGCQERAVEQLALDLAAPAADPNLSAFADEAHRQGPQEPSTGADPNLSAFADTPAADMAADMAGDVPLPSLDRDPGNRWFDRLLAHKGLLDDAAPLFGPAQHVPGAGVLLAVPALVASGVFGCAREAYGAIGPAFYGLRTTMTTLLLMALLRIKRPEGLKSRPPADLGRVLGLDRAPEVKTLRRKLKRLAAAGRAVDFGRALAKVRVASHGEAMGFLYLDGHVRVYHGKHTLPKAHVTRMRIAMPATTDYWLGDTRGDPLLVMTAEANAGMVAMLPAVLAEVRALVGERRVTVVFDRGGWSPALFARMVADGFDVLTYRKGRFPPEPEHCFSLHCAEIDGRKVEYTLADRTMVLPTRSGPLRLRQVTRRSDDGHQTPIVTSRLDLAAVEVAYRMFERWRQENFFKYLREHFALDALVEHAVEPDDPHRSVPNPARRKLDAELRLLRKELRTDSVDFTLRAGFEADIARLAGPAAPPLASAPPAALVDDILAKIRRYSTLRLRRDALPKRVEVGSVVKDPVVKLATERKHLTNLLKMVAYQAESDLARRIAPHYARAADEGRALIQSALASAADIAVDRGCLRIDLAPLAAPHRTRAVMALCAELNATRTQFPGARLMLRFGVRGQLDGESGQIVGG